MDALIERLRDWLARLRRPERDPGADEEFAPSTPSFQPFTDDTVVVTAVADDDVPSVIGRIDLAVADQVVLVVPREVRALRRANAWPHLAAHARRNGITLGVIADRAEVRAHAKAHGLPAATAIRGLRGARPRGSVRDGDAGTPAWGMRIRLAVLALSVAAAVLVACYRVPSATVVIVPPSETYVVSRQAQVNAVIDASDPTRGILSGSSIRRDVTTVVSTTTSGTAEVGDTPATLEIRFTNDGTADVRLPAGVRVATEDGWVFATDEAVTVPAGDQAVVTATAERPGTDGNVDIGDVSVLLSDVPTGITAVNRTRGEGGTDRTVAAVAAVDVDRVRTIAPGILQRIALSALRDEVTGGRLIESSVTAAIFSATPLQQLDEPADAFLMEYVIIAAALWVPDAEATAYGAALIRADLPSGLVLLPGTVSTVITEPDQPGGEVGIEVSGRVANLAPIDDLASAIAGKTPSAAAEVIGDRIALEAAPVITVRPEFVPWRWLPRRSSAIEITLAGPSEADGS